MVPISLCDQLSVSPRDDSSLELTCSWASGLQGNVFGDLPEPNNNLAYTALQLLRERADRRVAAVTVDHEDTTKAALA